MDHIMLYYLYNIAVFLAKLSFKKLNWIKIKMDAQINWSILSIEGNFFRWKRTKNLITKYKKFN